MSTDSTSVAAASHGTEAAATPATISPRRTGQGGGAVDARRRERRATLYMRLCTVPATLIVLLVAGVPLILLIVDSIRDQNSGAWTFEYYRATLTDSFFMRVLVETLLLGLIAAVGSVVVALPMAFLLARHTKLRNVVMPVMTVPRMLPFVVIGYGMILLLSPVTGILNEGLRSIGLLHGAPQYLFNYPGLLLAFSYSGIVVAGGILTGVLMGIDPELEKAAASMGANPLRAFRSVTLPLALPGVVAAGALIFSSTVTEYAIPVMIGGRTPQMVSVLIASNIQTLNETHLAFAQSVLVSVVSIGVSAAAQVWLLRRARR